MPFVRSTWVSLGAIVRVYIVVWWWKAEEEEEEGAARKAGGQTDRKEIP